VLIKKLYTRLAATQSALKRKIGKNGSLSSPTAQVPEVRDRDTDDYLKDLRSRNKELKRKNSTKDAQIKKLKSALERQKRKLGPFRRMATPRVSTGRKPRTNPRSPVRIVDDEDEDDEDQAPRRSVMLEEMLKTFADSAPSKRIKTVVSTLRNRLVTTERLLQQLTRERDELKRRQHRRRSNSNSNYDDSEDSDTLRRELRDRTAQLKLLNTRYEHLKSRSEAAREMQEHAVSQMDTYNRTIRELRREVQDLMADRTQLQIARRRMNEMEEEIRSVRAEAKELEEQNIQLCASPFINDASERRKHTQKLILNEKLVRQQKAQIVHLQETAKTHHASLLTLREQLSRVRFFSFTISLYFHMYSSWTLSFTYNTQIRSENERLLDERQVMSSRLHVAENEVTRRHDRTEILREESGTLSLLGTCDSFQLQFQFHFFFFSTSLIPHRNQRRGTSESTRNRKTKTRGYDSTGRCRWK